MTQILSAFFGVAVMCGLIYLIQAAPLEESDPGKPAGYVRGCYFTNWAQYRWGRAKFSPTNYQPGLCTHIFYAFAYINNSFLPVPSDPSDVGPTGQYTQVNNLKSTDSNLKTLLSFGGASFPSWTFQQMIATSTNRKVFINGAISYLRQYNFDGIDIDWEYPAASDKANYASLIQEFRQTTQQEAATTGRSRLLITAAVPAGMQNMAGYDFTVLPAVFDFINVMTYDFHGSWETVTGFNSPLFSRTGESDYQQQLNTAYVVNWYATQGFPKSKIIVGVASYGRGWTLSSPSNSGVGVPAFTTSNPFQFTQTPGIGAYFEICEVVAAGGVRTFDGQAGVPYVVQNSQWIGYDDSESAAAKANFVKSQGYGGVFVWTLDFDDFNGQCSDSQGITYPIIGTLRDILP